MNNRLQQLLELSQSGTEDTFVLFALAKEYEGLDDSTQALEYYLRLKAADPNYVGLYYHLGKLYEHLEDREGALTAYASGIEVARSSGDVHALSELNGAKMNLELE